MPTGTLGRHASGKHRKGRRRSAGVPPVDVHNPQPRAYYNPVIKRGKVGVVVPARNEEAQVGSTIQSLLSQTRPIDRIVVVANNCTDNTVEAARCVGVEVIEMRRNPYKKAGALNVGVQYLLKDGEFPEFIITIDADTDLEETYVERSINVMRRNPGLGGLSAVCFGKQGIGRNPYQRFLAWLQRVEYARAAWMRLRTNVHTLSGAGSVLRSRAILQVMTERGVLFAQRVDNLVEDFELTLELKRLGWACTNNYHCIAFTDVMPTFRGRRGEQGLWQQRTRWVRGTVNELRRRGWTRETRASIVTLIYGLVSVPLYYLWPIFLIYMAVYGQMELKDFWAIPLFSLYQAVSVRRLGWVSMLVAGTLVVDFLYGILRHTWLVASIVQSYFSSNNKTDWS